jgi:methylenetetrahydrofolate--tRNA-(uracil-5-)-methyltransferase
VRRATCDGATCVAREVPLTRIHIIGAGLAGSEAAWQAVSLGVPVVIHEMRPLRQTPVHRTGKCAELVCSNSFRGDKLDNAVGLLKEEMRRLGSLVMRAADATRVPAGAALAVDREKFSEEMTKALTGRPDVTFAREEMMSIPAPGVLDGPIIIATGPLTAESLSAGIAAFVGSDYLYFYDAVSPIVLAESIDMSKVFRASRWGRSMRGNGDSPHFGGSRTQMGTVPISDDGDYLNCPFTREEYERFIQAVVSAERADAHDIDNTRFFEGCLPIEVMAHRGADTLRFGPMKPVGLIDPRTGREAYAIAQLRQDTLAGDHFSLVGFQTQMKWGEQARVLRMIPGLENAEFVRFGMIHRNTYINAPTVLRETWQTRTRDDLFFAGQISGVEGYVESAASGLIAGRNAAALVLGRPLSVPPRSTALGALAFYVSHAESSAYQPTNITFGIIAPLGRKIRNKSERNMAISERALTDLGMWARAALSPDTSGPAGRYTFAVGPFDA